MSTNERIKELAVLARIQMVSEPRLQEFAELIIAECIEVFEATEYHLAYPDNHLGSYDGLELLESKIISIKKYFGIQ